MPEETAAREIPRGEAGTLARATSASRPLLEQVVGFGPEEVQTLRRMLSAVLHLTSLAFDEATGGGRGGGRRAGHVRDTSAARP